MHSASNDVALEQCLLHLPLLVLSAKPPITEVYSRCQKTIASIPLPLSQPSKGLELQSFLDVDQPIAL
ncbi:unnamed protein product [Ilex paraguariensis]|uniref:Uncharacterized protein n=1 Tax=Ilex paraguariensis TaxID=185542 RepID=A0ABC8S8X2_9AQUA